VRPSSVTYLTIVAVALMLVLLQPLARRVMLGPEPTPTPARPRGTSLDAAGMNACVPLFGSDSVIIAPAAKDGIPDEGLIVIARWDRARRAWIDCGVRQH